MIENEEYGAGSGGSGGGEPVGVAQQALGGGSGGGEPIGVAQQALDGGAGGDEPIGVAQQALGDGCCCPVVVGEGKTVKCYTVTDPSECKEQYFDGACNPVGSGICSVSGAVGAGGHGVVASVVTSGEGFALFFALAFCAVIRRRMK